MIDIVKNFYPETKTVQAEMIGDILKVQTADGDTRLYKFEGDKLYVYTPTLATNKDAISKIKSIIREGKINQVIK
jgi:hypothetical protein